MGVFSEHFISKCPHEEGHVRASCVPEEVCPVWLCSRTRTDCADTAPHLGKAGNLSSWNLEAF